MGRAASSSEPKLQDCAKSLSLKNLGKKSRRLSRPIRMNARNAKTRLEFECTKSGKKSRAMRRAASKSGINMLRRAKV